MARHEFTYDTDPEFYVSANREILWRTYGGWTVSFILVGVAAIVGLVTGSYRGFWSFCLGWASLYCYYLVQMWMRIQAFTKKMAPKQIKVVFDESGCTFESDVSRLWLSWSHLNSPRRYKKGILLERVDQSQSLLIPSEALSDEVYRFMDQSIKQSRLIKAKSSSISK